MWGRVISFSSVSWEILFLVLVDGNGVGVVSVRLVWVRDHIVRGCWALACSGHVYLSHLNAGCVPSSVGNQFLRDDYSDLVSEFEKR